MGESSSLRRNGAPTAWKTLRSSAESCRTDSSSWRALAASSSPANLASSLDFFSSGMADARPSALIVTPESAAFGEALHLWWSERRTRGRRRRWRTERHGEAGAAQGGANRRWVRMRGLGSRLILSSRTYASSRSFRRSLAACDALDF
eukprot:scaffold764_cov248-Pinguiococcus_pyrenoidosus.AAC.25